MKLWEKYDLKFLSHSKGKMGEKLRAISCTSLLEDKSFACKTGGMKR